MRSWVAFPSTRDELLELIDHGPSTNESSLFAVGDASVGQWQSAIKPSTLQLWDVSPVTRCPHLEHSNPGAGRWRFRKEHNIYTSTFTNLENSCTNYVAGPLRQSGLLQNLSRYTTLILNSRHNASLSEDNEGRRARRRFNFDHNLHKFTTICQWFNTWNCAFTSNVASFW